MFLWINKTKNHGFTRTNFVKQNLRGFTLVELLVVIAIIAILAVVGITVFSGVQKSARDARRRADIDAIVNALEVYRTSGGYIPLQPTQFANNKVPYDPNASSITTPSPPTQGCGDSTSGSVWVKGCWYCIKEGKTLNTYCSGDSWLNSNFSGSGGVLASWTVCANLENLPGYYCRSNQQ